MKPRIHTTLCIGLLAALLTPAWADTVDALAQERAAKIIQTGIYY
jgi:hypothetical protein